MVKVNEVTTPPNSDADLPSYIHPLQERRAEDYQMLMDVWEGLKDTNTKSRYLYAEELEPRQSYLNRLKRTAFQNRFAEVIKGFVGVLGEFNIKEPDSPKTIIDFKDNIDLKGNNLVEFLYKIDSMALRDGFSCILIEKPKVEVEIKTNRDYLNSGLRPYLVAIDARQIVNWQVELINGVPKLVQVTIQESREVKDGRYGIKTETYYRVLTPGYYELLRIEDDKVIVEEEGETGLTGEIPLVYYSLHSSSDWFEAEAPFYNFAEINLESYRKKSSLSELIRKVAIPILVRGISTNIQELKTLAKEPVVIGSNSVVDIVKDGTFTVAETSGASISAIEENIEKLNHVMNRMSLSFLSEGVESKTATEVGLDATQVKSTVSTMIGRKQNLIQTVFKYWSQYTGEVFNPDAGIDINKTILETKLKAEEVDKLISLASQGLLSVENLLITLKAGRFLPQDLDLTSELSTTIDTEGDVVGG